jgi:ion channel-forming bestrophin family protein
MQIGHHFPTKDVLHWTRFDILRHLLIATLITAAYVLLGWRWLAIPWLPVALIGTAVAFLTGFKNNASYDRLWEARRIWGAIVNASRSWGLMARDYVTDRCAVDGATPDEVRDAHRELYHRHFAWLTALRFALREPRAWEAIEQRSNAEYKERWFVVEEQTRGVAEAMAPYIGADEFTQVMGQSNKAAQLLALQSAHLERLLRRGLIEDFRHIELTRVLAELLAQQGAAERIKNFPYPRQYATMNLWFINIFVLLVPLGMLKEFEKLGGALIWLGIPFSALAGWIFTTMEKIGEGTENPFEGGANDVPITQLSRMIEIDLRQMLGEQEVPPPIEAQHNILT